MTTTLREEARLAVYDAFRHDARALSLAEPAASAV